MFRGDNADLVRTIRRAGDAAVRLGHPRVGSEHLLLALAGGRGPLGDVWALHAVSMGAVQDAVVAAAPAGAGVAADRDALSPLGISIDGLLRSSGATVLDQPPLKEPLFPLGIRRAREHCARSVPPIGLDAQAASEASLRLALARREKEHRTEHLALALAALDPGVNWVLARIGADGQRLLSDLADAFPPPRRNWLIRAERRIGRRLRNEDIARRYQHTSGRVAMSAAGAVRLLGG
jgi:hypothetical protein